MTMTATATSTSTSTTTATTTTQTHDDYNTRCNENSNGGDDVDGIDGNDDETAAATAAATIALAKEIAEQIHSSADILLEKLFSHLSKLPEEEEVVEEEEEIINDCSNPTTCTCTSLLDDNDNNNNNENENDTQLLQRGITIPVSAVAWLSGQFDALDIFNNNNNNNNTKSASYSETYSYDIEQWIEIESTVSLRYRLNLLRFLLPRIQLIRVTRQPWPFTTTDKDNNNNTILDRIDDDINNAIILTNISTKSKLESWFRRKRRHRHQQQLVHTTISSTTTTADATAAEEFLRYTKMLIHGGGGGSGISSSKYVNLQRVFPNAKVLILEGVPPSWIDINNQNQNQNNQNQNNNNNSQKNPATTTTGSCSCSHSTPTSSRLQVITVRKAAIYNLNEFLGTSHHHHHHHHRRKKEEQQESIITEEKEEDDTTVTGLSTTTTTTEPLQLEISIEGRMQQQQQHQEKVTSLSLPLPLPSLSLPSLSLSLTHLKLESCCLGELTIGFISSIQQLDQLTYLSLRDNKFRKSRTILTAIQGLCKLQYMDISNNCLMHKFGPNANLYLGGQVRTLKLSGNLLRTCQGSGLEKCYAIQHLYLDNNLIDTVIEVSGLVRLPELQTIQLQNNPFTTTTKGKEDNDNNNNNDNSISNSNTPSYDPDWKIRLWTWFQQERRVINPLELPNIGKRKMTKDEWDRIQQESFSSSSSSSVLLAITDTNAITTATAAAAATTTSIGIEAEIETRAVGDDDIVVAAAGDDTPPPLADYSTSSSVTEDSSIFLGSPLRPVRNRKVTKTSKPRQAKINNNNTGDVKIHNNNNSTTKGERRQRSKKKMSSHSSGRRRMQPLKTSSKMYVSSTNFITDTHDRDEKIRSTSTDGVGGLDLSFSLEDVLVSLQQPHPQQQESEKLDQIIEIKEEERSNQQHGDKELSTSEIVSSKTEEGEIVSSIDNVEEKKVGGEENVTLTSPYTNNRNNPFIEESEDDVSKEESDSNDIINDSTMVLDQKKETVNDKLIASKSEPENSKLEDDCHEADKESSSIRDNIDEGDDQDQSRTTDEASTTESSISTPQTSPQRPKTATATSASISNIEDRIFLKPKMATIKLARGAPNYSKTFDVLDSDWEELIERASEGRIPDGLLKSPVETTNESRNNGAIGDDGNVFSDTVTNLLVANTTTESATRLDTTDPASASRSASSSGSILDPSLTSSRIKTALPEHVWQDDNSVLSSLGGVSRDDLRPKRANKFQLAEENSEFDGPDSCRGMNVVENLHLYFDSYVFPTSLPDIPQSVLEEMEGNEDDWQLTTLYHPRIQLWPDDRRLLERKRIMSASTMLDSADWTANRERFLRVWEEDIVPCGKPALRRLQPNRRIRLGFHGDKLFEDSDVNAYSECRKVLLCLSSEALYVITEKDDITIGYQQQAKKRRFPLPIDRGDRFRDAPWPHAVARHSLGDLQAICIGFEFQRLTLRFKNTSQLPTSSDPFVYVLLTGDKRSTVRIFQEIQKLAKDLHENNGITNIGSSSLNNKKNSVNSIVIENDSQLVLDGLNNLIESSGDQQQIIGTILHFQIVQQRWNRGNRGTVRRVCVVTDTRIMLLDEDYTADGHDLSTVTVKGDKMAEVKYRLVDQATLSLVSQVQAANTDPCSITILITPSALSRTHRWRLICRDREGAERLVEDARKALES